MPKKQKIQTLLSAKSTAELHAEVVAELEANIPDPTDPEKSIAKLIALEEELKEKDEEKRAEDQALIAEKLLLIEELKGDL